MAEQAMDTAGTTASSSSPDKVKDAPAAARSRSTPFLAEQGDESEEEEGSPMAMRAQKTAPAAPLIQIFTPSGSTHMPSLVQECPNCGNAMSEESRFCSRCSAPSDSQDCSPARMRAKTIQVPTKTRSRQSSIGSNRSDRSMCDSEPRFEERRRSRTSISDLDDSVLKTFSNASFQSALSQLPFVGVENDLTATLSAPLSAWHFKPPPRSSRQPRHNSFCVGGLSAHVKQPGRWEFGLEIRSRLAVDYPQYYATEGDPTGFVPSLEALKQGAIPEDELSTTQQLARRSEADGSKFFTRLDRLVSGDSHGSFCADLVDLKRRHGSRCSSLERTSSRDSARSSNDSDGSLFDNENPPLELPPWLARHTQSTPSGKPIEKKEKKKQDDGSSFSSSDAFSDVSSTKSGGFKAAQGVKKDVVVNNSDQSGSGFSDVTSEHDSDD